MYANYYYFIIYAFESFFKSESANGLSLQFEWLQITSRLKVSSNYSCQS